MRAWNSVAVRRQVVVNLQTGLTFRGVLYKQTGPLLVLKNAQLLEPGQAPVELAGEVVIERKTVDFVQVVS
jgi:small nuclear ribonucleoprotein (snRNP)-like protein